MSVNRPLERTTPPSEDSKNMPVLFGLTTSACWSGWIPFGAYGVGSQQEPAGAGAIVASRAVAANSVRPMLDVVPGLKILSQFEPLSGERKIPVPKAAA